jgi:hypothetical protein
MKTVLSYICYYVGDFMYKLSESTPMKFEGISYFFFRLYQRCMSLSVDLDVNYRVWGEPLE